MNLNVFESFLQIENSFMAGKCIECSDNSYVNANKDGCTTCSDNSYVNANKDGCTTCPPNSYVNANKDGCTTCPPNSYVNANKDGCTYKNNVYIYKENAKEDDEYDEEINEMLIDEGKSWVKCADEDGECTCNGYVYYGSEPYFSKPKEVNGKIACNNETFGDSYTWVRKKCYCDYNAYLFSGVALNFNDKINSIRLPPNSHISYFEHGIGEGECFDMSNNTNTSKRFNVHQNARGKVTGIRYGKTCQERPQNGEGTPH